jgi:proliferating cell nuclear antigen
MAVMLKCWSGEVELDRFAKEDNLLYAKNIDEYGTHYRKMGTIDTAAMPDSKVPSLDMPAKFNIHVKPIIKFTKQAETVSDHLSITAGPKGIQFFAEGDIDTVEFIPGSLDKYAINKEYRSLFSTDYFSNLIVTMKLFFDMVEIQLGTDNPIRVNGMGKIKAMYLLAPRIESENRVNVSSRY